MTAVEWGINVTDLGRLRHGGPRVRAKEASDVLPFRATTLLRPAPRLTQSDEGVGVDQGTSRHDGPCGRRFAVWAMPLPRFHLRRLQGVNDDNDTKTASTA